MSRGLSIAEQQLELPGLSLNTVVCGTFRREASQLRSDFSALEMAGCEVLSPVSVDFVQVRDGFALTEDELERPASAIQREHVAALLRADFVWLHAPEGYVGSSGAFELGVAHLAGIPVFSRAQPSDVALAQFVRSDFAPQDAVRAVGAEWVHKPGQPLKALQRYYESAADRRGWGSESPSDTAFRLVGEVGELITSLQKSGFSTRRHALDESALELADVQLYVIHLANVLGIDLAAAVSLKEEINAARFPIAAAAEEAVAA